MALSAEQLADMQGDLGITDDETVFTDDELNRLYTRAGEDYKTAVYYGWQQLMANSAKFFTYSAGQSKVERAQIFEHVKAMVAHWKDESETGGNQMRMLGLNGIPTQHKETPDTYRRRSFSWRRD
jgi:hypothetical protein